MPAAKEKPILFSGPMVRAILDGRKTQTRRPIKPQPDQDIDDLHGGDFRGRAPYAMECNETGRSTGFGFEDDHGRRWQCPFGPPGTLLWVRKTWQKSGMGWGNDLPMGKVHYRATDDGEWKEYWGKWKPSIHMPRWASRITLRNKRTWVERVQDISEKDARAEGMIKEFLPSDPDNFHPPYSYGFIFCPDARLIHPTAKEAFSDLWKSAYLGSWDRNEWVWACEFERVPSAT